MDGRPFIICNPAAAGGRAAGRWRALERLLARERIRYEVAMTSSPRHAVGLAAGAVAAGFRRVAAFGGDGTLHEVVQGLMASPDGRPGAALLFLGAGSNSDFDKPFEPRSWIGRLQHGRPKAIDLIRIRCTSASGTPIVEYAVNGSNIGLVVEATRRFESARLLERAPTDLRLIAAGIGAVGSHAPLRCTVSVDGTTEELTVDNILLFKTPWLGGAMHLRGSGVVPDDGLLAHVIMTSAGRWRLLHAIAALYAGSALRLPNIRWGRCTSLTVTTDLPAMVEADGEIAGRTPARYTILSGGIDVIV
jgi:diacylglycerol kinase (ATP)